MSERDDTDHGRGDGDGGRGRDDGGDRGRDDDRPDSPGATPTDAPGGDGAAGDGDDGDAPDGDDAGGDDDADGEGGRTTVVVGVGEGLGSSVARRFAAAGDDVGLVARSEDRLQRLAATLRAETPGRAVAAPADVTDPDGVAAAFDRIRTAFGPVDAMVDCVYSTGTESGGLLDVDPAAFEAAWRVETAGAFRCAREAAGDMVEGGGGTVVFTNSAAGKRAGANGVARSSARFGLRGLAESMARDLAPSVHVVHVTIDGWLGTPTLREAHPDRPEAAWVNYPAVNSSCRFKH